MKDLNEAWCPVVCMCHMEAYTCTCCVGLADSIQLQYDCWTQVGPDLAARNPYLSTV